jgi:hypothetical protein
MWSFRIALHPDESAGYGIKSKKRDIYLWNKVINYTSLYYMSAFCHSTGKSSLPGTAQHFQDQRFTPF